MAAGGDSPGSRNNVRLYPRFECFASVKVSDEGASVLLKTRNVSLGGVLLEAGAREKRLLPLGKAIQVVLFKAMDEDERGVTVSAGVVRHDADGVALAWNATDPDTAYDLADLIEKLKPT
jgi:PilZ domain